MSPPHRRSAPALLALLLAACAPGAARPGGAAGAVAGVEGLVVESHLWRNFQPRTDRPDSCLAALIQVRSRDRAPLPAGVRVSRAVLRHGRETWSTVPRQEEPRWSPDALEVVARGGPAWAPGSMVDVTIEVHDGRGRARRVHLKGQRIRRLD